MESEDRNLREYTEGEEIEAPDLGRGRCQRVIINSRKRERERERERETLEREREKERDLKRGVCLKNRENVGGDVSLSVVEYLKKLSLFCSFFLFASLLL